MILLTIKASRREVCMTRHTILLPLVCMLGMLSVLVSASGAMGSPSQSAQGTPEVLTATVRALDTRAQTLEVITGVGHALRLMRFQVSPRCEIRVAGAAAQLRDLKAGNIVRIQYRQTPSAMMAERIESVEVER